MARKLLCMRRCTESENMSKAILFDVKALEDSEQMRGGLYIPDTAKEKPQQGEVVAVGPGKFEDGKRIEMELKVGDKVLYGKYSGTEVTLDDQQYLILRESDVLAVIS